MSRRNHAFTLVELLVVMAIISLLAAMLLPVLDQTLATARNMRCLNRMKQGFTYLALYGSDFGEYPTNYAADMPTSWNWGDECGGRWHGNPPSQVRWTSSDPYEYPVQGKGARVRFLEVEPEADLVTRCTADLPSEGGGWRYTMRPPNQNRSGNGIYVYDGPHSAGNCISNNSAMSGLTRVSLHGGTTQLGVNWGVRFSRETVRRSSGEVAVSQVAILGCPSIYEVDQQLYYEPHAYPRRIVTFTAAGMGNGQFDRYNAAAYIARNYCYGDGHAKFITAHTRLNWQAP